MAQPLRIEHPERVSFITTRTAQSRLWFINNLKFEQEVLAYLGKYASKYGIILYAAVFQGNHFHITAKFPEMNRAAFMRDMNAAVQRSLKRHQSQFKGSHLWDRRYSEEWVPLASDILDRVFYCALQPIANGLTERIGDYPGYNSFFDAINGREKSYSLFDASAYYLAKRRDPSVRKADFYRSYTLKYSRPPQCDSMTPSEYKKFMLDELERRTAVVKQKRIDDGKSGFLGRDRIINTSPGAEPVTTKKSTRHTRRPLVLTSCSHTRSECLLLTFSIRKRHREASKLYLLGEATTFPEGTYPPPGSLKRA